MKHLEDTTEETEVLAYYDLLAMLDQAPDSVPERLESLVMEVCLAALGGDRDFFATVVRTGIQRGRGVAMLQACHQHRGEEEIAEQALAESAGVLTPIAPPGR